MTLSKILAFGFVFLLLLTTCSKSDDDTTTETETQVNAQDFSTSIDENPAQGAEIGIISASTNVGTLSFSIVTQSISGAINVDASSGVISVNDAAAFDYESVTAITATVRVSSGDTSTVISITISLNDLDDMTNNTADATLWTGAMLTFTKQDGADPAAEENQDRITDNVWITRGNGGGQIFNIKKENAAIKAVSPADTEWALGSIDDIESLTFAPFRTTIKPQNVVGEDLVLHLISDNIYLSVKFTSWSSNKAGGFAYERSTEN